MVTFTRLWSQLWILKKQCLILNVVNFLQDELINGNLNDERKESVDVAIQCLETAFELDTDARTKLGNEKLDLLSLINITPKVEVSEEQKKKRSSVVEYTKAIQLDPTNAVYYCNRAAAYSRLEKHLEAINDCKEAIKLDPAYGKAYGRLGIAYSNLNKYEDARAAYLTALKYDPGNAMYETNLKLAEERLFADMGNVFTLIYHMSAIMSMGESGDPHFNALFQAGQTLASRMQSADPTFVESLRRSLDPENNSSAPAETTNNDFTPEDSKESDRKPEC
ncbi:hypothetical protein NQ314_016322 [Rhamnusium bicolor]|uniref:SGTA homodimerisation domain-containing protein n=1 Tax=Rhamnusium bicolor TaxID=1586634 RepID=A0AAV8WWP8_9CUCU|nr:hypothetical protein NQ314_016322 [Rhamnusium bicolor]